MVLRNQELLTAQNELRESNLKLELAVDEATTAKQQAHLMLEELSRRDSAIRKTNEELHLIHSIESLINQNNDWQSLFRLVSEKLCNARQFGIRDFVHISLAELDNTSANESVCLQEACCYRCELPSTVIVHAGPVAMSCNPTGVATGKMTIPLVS